MTTSDRARRLAIGIALALPLALAGCIQGQGPVTTETRDTRPFTRLEVGAGIQVDLAIGAAGPLRVTAQANVLPAIETSVSGDTLRIAADRDFTTTAPVTVTVTVPVLDAVSLSGGAQARIEGVSASTLGLGVNGGARATVLGSVGSVVLDADGGSTVDLRGLAAGTADVRLAGGATATVSATSRVSGSASGGAHLVVLGNAALDVQASGGAEVSRGTES